MAPNRRYLSQRCRAVFEGGARRKRLRRARDLTRRFQRHREMRAAAGRLILNRAPVEAITRQLALALFTDAPLDLRS